MKHTTRIAIMLFICAAIATYIFKTTEWENVPTNKLDESLWLEPIGEVGETPEAHKSVLNDSSIAAIHYYIPTFYDLLDAIEWVESRGDANAMGDWVTLGVIRYTEANEPILAKEAWAIGAYQIHKIYVDDVNRIMEKTWITPPVFFSYNDRWNKYQSREMVLTYLRYYEGQTPTDLGAYPFGNMSWQERLARIHNGGPDGWKKESTKPYWEKVKARMYETRKAWDEYTFNQYAEWDVNIIESIREAAVAEYTLFDEDFYGDTNGDLFLLESNFDTSYSFTTFAQDWTACLYMMAEDCPDSTITFEVTRNKSYTFTAAELIEYFDANRKEE